MIIKVNKSQEWDNWEDEYERICWRANIPSTFGSVGAPNTHFETEDVTPEQLLDYIDKGYGIKINC